jgi:hypothetical protein
MECEAIEKEVSNYVSETSVVEIEDPADDFYMKED